MSRRRPRASRARPPQLAVVIPTLDEAVRLPSLLAQLAAQRGSALQVIVADGGSTDGTQAVATAHGATLVAAPCGRGAQMNRGAAAATAKWLLFLHADSGLTAPTLLADALAALRRERDPRVAGHFALRFARSDREHERFFRYLEGKTRLSRPGTINGDQGLLLTAAFFAEIGGYDERLPFLEDQRIAAAIAARGRWQLLPGVLTTSARRFETEGHRERYTLMSLIMGLHAAGVDEFFTGPAPAYAPQATTGHLDLGPFVDRARAILAARGARGAAAVLLRVGRFIRENAWQLAYYVDVRRGRDDLAALHAFDRHVAPLLAHRGADALAAALACAWFFGWLPLQRLARRAR